jgi:hypothetical protein
MEGGDHANNGEVSCHDLLLINEKKEDSSYCRVSRSYNGVVPAFNSRKRAHISEESTDTVSASTIECGVTRALAVTLRDSCL